MTVTLSYTSKGLIDAVQRELQKQKSEGKISGDTSFKSITSGKFWSTIKKINDNHDSNNKVYHGKDVPVDNNRGKVIDWTKTAVVYGSTTFTDEEWQELLCAIGLELTSKTKTEEIQTQEESQTEEPRAEEPASVEKDVAEEDEDNDLKITYDVPTEDFAVFITFLQKLGYGIGDAEKFLSDGNNIEYKNGELTYTDKEGNSMNESQALITILAQKYGYDSNDAKNFLSNGNNIKYENGKLIYTSKDGSSLSENQVLEIMKVNKAKNGFEQDITTEADNEICTENQVEE